MKCDGKVCKRCKWNKRSLGDWRSDRFYCGNENSWNYLLDSLFFSYNTCDEFEAIEETNALESRTCKSPIQK